MIGDILPRSNRRWGIALLVLLCVSAILFITPWICSTLFLTPFDWHEDAQIVHKQKQGNRILNCTPAGPCVSCSYAERQSDTKFSCTLTGYHQPFKCIDAGDKGSSTGNDKNVTGDAISREKKVEDDGKTVNDGFLNLSNDDLNTYRVYDNCLPSDVREKLSVLGFEGVILAALAVSAPVVVYRKRSIIAMAGMTRVPSNARF